MKIFEIATGFTPIPARIGAATEIVVQNLVNSFSKGNEVTLIDVRNKNRTGIDCPVREINMPQWLMGPSSFMSLKHKLKRVLYSMKLAIIIKKITQKESGRTILHFHNQYNFAFSYAWSYFFKKNKKENVWVYTVHSNLWFDEVNGKPQKKHFLEIYTIKRADIVICLNTRLSENLKRYFEGSLSGRLEVIPNGVNDSVYHPVEKEAGNSRLKIINVGSVYEGKNQLESLRIITPFLKSDQCEFYFAGANVDPSYMEQINSYVKTNGINRNVHYLGECLPGEELNKVYNIADIYISNSKSEGFSLVILEALATGLPVVLSQNFQLSLGDIPATNAICFCENDLDFEKMIQFYLNDKNELKKISATGRQMIEAHYSWRQIAALHEEFFAG